jgi:hypothetical protein
MLKGKSSHRDIVDYPSKSLFPSYFSFLVQRFFSRDRREVCTFQIIFRTLINSANRPQVTINILIKAVKRRPKVIQSVNEAKMKA